MTVFRFDGADELYPMYNPPTEEGAVEREVDLTEAEVARYWELREEFLELNYRVEDALRRAPPAPPPVPRKCRCSHVDLVHSPGRCWVDVCGCRAFQEVS